ncbi:MAG: YggS family pyridoxal phosphate-dependent enzyme [Actinomycetota bacterium]
MPVDPAARLAEVRDRIGAACARVGRDPDDVTIVGATKRVPIERVAAAFEAGLRDVGENDARELRKRAPLLPAATWHYLGPLQSGSARLVAEHAAVVHTIAPGGGLERLSTRLAATGRELRGLVQVDFTGSRNGVAPEELPAFAHAAEALPGIHLVGLMTIAPLDPDPEAARPAFRALRALAEGLRGTVPGVLALSMGMSLDYEVAVEEGATMVRLGTALFGDRPETN